MDAEKWGINQETLSAIRSKENNGRKMGLVEIAEAAAAGFGNPDDLMPQSEIKKYLNDPILSIVYAELGRIAVDKNKTLANQIFDPRHIYKRLNISAHVLQATTLNSEYKNSPNIRNTPFVAEGKRDHLKTIDAAALLYPYDKNEFYAAGDKILQELYSDLPNGHPTKPLVAIEIQLRNEIFGKPIDRDFVMKNYRELIEYTMTGNPDRAATVSAWLIGLGQRTNDFEMGKAAFANFSILLKQNDEYKNMTDKEKLRRYKKLDKDKLRQKLQVE